MNNAEANPTLGASQQTTVSPASQGSQGQSDSHITDTKSIFGGGGGSEESSQSQGQNQTQQTQQTQTQEPAQQSQTQQQQSANTTATTTAPTPPPAQPAPVDVKTLAQSIVQAQAEAQRQNQVAAQNQGLTEDQFNQKYGIVPITENHIRAIFDQDPKKAAMALQQVLDAKVRQAVLMAQGVISPELSNFREQLSPVQQMIKTQQEEQLWSEFSTFAQDLKEERQLVTELVQAHLARKTAFPGGKQEAFKTVAEQARSLIARLRGQTGTTQQTQQTSNTQQSQSSAQSHRPSGRTMTPTLTGGRSASGTKATPSDAQMIFGASSNPAFSRKT